LTTSLWDPHRRASAITKGIVAGGVLVLIVLWAVVAVSVIDAREAAMGQARSVARNLAIAFDDEVQNTLAEIVRGMDFFTKRIRENSGHFDLYEWVRENPLLQPGVEAAIIAPNGVLLSSTRGPVVDPVDLSDREHFRIHQDGNYQGLFIGHAILGRRTNHYILPVSRRITGIDGGFLGVLVFLITPETLTKLHKHIDLSAHDVIALAGPDGVIRARFARDSLDGTNGIDIRTPGPPGGPQISEIVEGSFIQASVLDGIVRLYNFRRIGAYPLFVSVGVDLQAALAIVDADARLVLSVGAIATVILLALVAYLIREIRSRIEANAALTIEIGERRAAEEELRRSEALLAQGQKLTRTASWTFQPSTGEMRWSGELFDLFGVDRAAANPSLRLFSGRLHPDDRLCFKQQLKSAARCGGDFLCEVRVVVCGTTKHMQVVGAIQPAGEHGLEIIGTVMDLTERKRTEQALHDAEAELARTLRLATVAELAASIAHEINQPLAAIVANASACLRSLARRPPALGDAREAAKGVVSDGIRTGEVIARIRALLSKQGPRHVPLDVNDVIGEVLDLSRGAIERQGITVHTEMAASPPPILGDPVQLRQVLVNLVTNAAEAMTGVVDRSRQLTIRSAVERGQSVAVTVEDTGSGLDAVDLDRIFDSFYTTKPEGIGVGLSISRSIIEAHGGHLSVKPVTPHGARFCFRLPVVDAGSAEFGNTPAQRSHGEHAAS
jgi:signal transduction histidine kinase